MDGLLEDLLETSKARYERERAAVIEDMELEAMTMALCLWAPGESSEAFKQRTADEIERLNVLYQSKFDAVESAYESRNQAIRSFCSKPR